MQGLLVVCSFKNTVIQNSNFSFHFPKRTLSVQLYFPNSKLPSTKGQMAHTAHAKLAASISLLSRVLAFQEPLVLVALQ